MHSLYIVQKDTVFVSVQCIVSCNALAKLAVLKPCQNPNYGT